MTAADDVAARWRKAGLPFNDGASSEALDAIEKAHSVRLPASFRRLWSLSDGTGTDDEHWLIFGQTSDMIDPMYAPRTANGVRLIFADWKLGTPFALLLDPDDRGVFALEKRAKLVAPSFDEFLRLYLTRVPIWPAPR